MTYIDGCAVCQLKGVARPPVTLPVEILERSFHAVILPVAGIALRITTTGCRKFQLQSGGCFAQVNAGIGHVNIERIAGYTALESHGYPSLFRETVHISLRCSRDTNLLSLHIVTENGHCGRSCGGVVHYKIEFHLLELSGFQEWGQVVGRRKDTAVGKAHHRADKRGTITRLEDIDVNAFRFQRQVRTRLHLGDHLNRMPAYAEPGHRKVETSIGGTAAGHRVGVLLFAVHVQGDHLCPGSANSVGKADRVVCIITTPGDASGKIITACQ